MTRINEETPTSFGPFGITDKSGKGELGTFREGDKDGFEKWLSEDERRKWLRLYGEIDRSQESGIAPYVFEIYERVFRALGGPDGADGSNRK